MKDTKMTRVVVGHMKMYTTFRAGQLPNHAINIPFIAFGIALARRVHCFSFNNNMWN